MRELALFWEINKIFGVFIQKKNMKYIYYAFLGIKVHNISNIPIKKNSWNLIYVEYLQIKENEVV